MNSLVGFEFVIGCVILVYIKDQNRYWGSQASVTWYSYTTSETDPFVPDRNGFLFEDLTRLMNKSYSRKIVTILDCCYSGAARLGKGSSDEAANLGNATIDDVSNTLERGEGKCILAASQSYQRAFETAEQDHSLFTYYLLEGLKGKQAQAVNDEGCVTPESLGKYVYNTIMSLSQEKRPTQKPIRKVEELGDIVLAYYPELRRTSKTELGIKTNDHADEAQISDFAKNVIKVEEYINSKTSDKKPFNILECATDLGISINEVKDIISKLKKRKKNRNPRWNTLTKAYSTFQEYSDLDLQDLVRLPWWKWKQSRKKK
jgi:hypothetical protein